MGEVILNFSKKDERIFRAFCLVAQESSKHSEISIPKIAQKLDISRQAFHYSYYKNIDELINSLHYYIDQDAKKIFKNHILKNSISFKELIDFFAYEIIPELYDKREYIGVLYGGIADPGWIPFIHKTYMTCISFYNYKEEFNVHIFISEAISIVSSWMLQETIESPITFSNKFVFFMTHSPLEIVEH